MSIFIHIGASGAIVPAPACIIETETTHTLTTSTTINSVDMGPGLQSVSELALGSIEQEAAVISSAKPLRLAKDSKPSSNYHGYANCFGLPYQDHNYGAPPPPTPPQSPKPNDVLVDDDTNFSVISTTSTTNEEELPQQGESITRCICGFNHDDEYMICCDKCVAWQHVDCMGLDRNNMPDAYMCERCAPRKVDKQKAKALQAKKKERMTVDSSSDDTRDDYNLNKLGQHRGGNRRGAATKRGRSERRNSLEGIRPAKKFKSIKEREIKKTKTRRRTKSRSETSNTVDEEAQDAWVYSFSESGDKYEEASCNQYTNEVQSIINTLKLNGQHDEFSKKVAEVLDVRLCRMGAVGGGQKGLVASGDLPAHQAVAEFKGKVLTLPQFKTLNPIFNKRCYPYVLFYRLNPGTDELCVDARVFGSETRFVRRSCNPNAIVRHTVQNGLLRFFLFSCCEIKRGLEVTIPFDFYYKDCSMSDVECACGRDDCTFGVQINHIPIIETPHEPRRKRASKKNSIEEDSSLSSAAPPSLPPPPPPPPPIMMVSSPIKVLKPPVTPVKIAVSPVKIEPVKVEEPCEVSASVPSSQTVPEVQEQSPESTTKETNNAEEIELQQQAGETRKKMTREERKIDAIMRAFERMEKLAKRRQQNSNRGNNKFIEQDKSQPETPKEEEPPAPLSSAPSTPIKKEICEEKATVSVITSITTTTLPPVLPAPPPPPNLVLLPPPPIERSIGLAELAEAAVIAMKEEAQQQKSVNCRTKKGKRRRGSGTMTRRRNRTSSGGSDLLSPDETPLVAMASCPLVPTIVPPISSGNSNSSTPITMTPVIIPPVLATVVSEPVIVNHSISLLPPPNSGYNSDHSATLSPAPTIHSPSKPECVIPKSKRYLMQEWLQEKAETSPVPTSCPLSIRTEMGWNVTVPKPPTCYVRCTRDMPGQGGISASLLRRNSTSSNSALSGSQKPNSLGSAKKRWLRQAMVENVTPGVIPGLPVNGLISEEMENGNCSPLHNGCMSPVPNCDTPSPNSISPPGGDIVTPLKKRRLMRESLDSTSPGMLSPSSGGTGTDRPHSASSSNGSPDHQSHQGSIFAAASALVDAMDSEERNASSQLNAASKNAVATTSCNLAGVDSKHSGDGITTETSQSYPLSVVPGREEEACVDDSSLGDEIDWSKNPQDCQLEETEVTNIEEQNLLSEQCLVQGDDIAVVVAQQEVKSETSAGTRADECLKIDVTEEEATTLKKTISSNQVKTEEINLPDAAVLLEAANINRTKHELECHLVVPSCSKPSSSASDCVITNSLKQNCDPLSSDVSTTAANSVNKEVVKVEEQLDAPVIVESYIEVPAFSSSSKGNNSATFNKTDSSEMDVLVEPFKETLHIDSSVETNVPPVILEMEPIAPFLDSVLSPPVLTAIENPSSIISCDTTANAISLSAPVLAAECVSSTTSAHYDLALNSHRSALPELQSSVPSSQCSSSFNATDDFIKTSPPLIVAPPSAGSLNETFSPLPLNLIAAGGLYMDLPPPGINVSAATPMLASPTRNLMLSQVIPSGGGSSVVSSSSCQPKRKVSLSEYRMRMRDNVGKSSETCPSVNNGVCSPIKEDPALSSSHLPSSSSFFLLPEHTVPSIKRKTLLFPVAGRVVQDGVLPFHQHSVNVGSLATSPITASNSYIAKVAVLPPFPMSSGSLPPPPPPPPIPISVLSNPSVSNLPPPPPPPLPHHHNNNNFIVNPAALQRSNAAVASTSSSTLINLHSNFPTKNASTMKPGPRFVHQLVQPPPPPPPPRPSIVATVSASFGAMVHKLTTLPPPPPPPPPPRNAVSSHGPYNISYKEPWPQKQV